MSLTITNDSVHEAYYDTESLTKIKYGSERVWPQKDVDPDACLVFESDERGTLEISQGRILIYTRDDLDDWVPWTGNSDPADFGGDLGPLYVKRNPNHMTGPVNHFHQTSGGLFSVRGPLMALFAGDVFTEYNHYPFEGIFKDNVNLVDASGLVFPDVMYDGYMYAHMFEGCVKLERAPELPMQQLTEYCYSYMFCDCVNLKEAPALPATTLRKCCYEGMFTRCTSLTKAPALPAQELVEGCYSYMFQSCEKLTDGPSLTASAVAKGSYSHMFQYCPMLKDLPNFSFDTIGAAGCAYMFDGCTSLTKPLDFIVWPKSERAFAYMFNDCTNVTGSAIVYGLAVPGNPMGEYSYVGMYRNTGITSAAINDMGQNMSRGCYDSIFAGCKNLSTLMILMTTCPSGNWDDYMSWWCQGVASSGTFQRYPGCTLPFSTADDPHEAYKPYGWLEINL